MQIKISSNAAQNYIQRCYRGMSSSCGKLHNQSYVDMLYKVQNMWLEVETDHLFEDQFNISNLGLRVMEADVVEIKNDLRHGLMKCQWCYGYDHNKDGFCDNCDSDEHLFLLKE